MEELKIEVQPREEMGKNACKRLRAEGIVPAVVYGMGKEPVPIKVATRTVKDLVRKAGSEHAVFLLQMAGTSKSRHTMIREMRLDVLTRRIEHIDFQRVSLDEKVRVEVPIEVTGVPLGVKNDGGVLDFVTRAVLIECLPGNIPQHLEVDVSELHIGQHVEVGAIALPEGVVLMDDESRVVASVAMARVVEEAEDEEGEDLLEAGTAEPEVIGSKPSDEDEG